MQEIEDNFKSNGGKFEEFKIGDLFEIKSNPQLNKDSFHFSANGEYPYFTRTVLNNGFAGYVDYLDEEHKIKGNSLAVGMLGMQFFYMKKDFYAGQFTKTAFPKFKGFNETLAQYFIVLLNKYQKVFQGVLVRDFEELFNDSLIQLPTQNGEIAFDYMEAYIKELEADRVKELEAYLIATGLKDYTLTAAEQTALETFEKSIKINNLTQMGGGKPYLPAVDFQTFKIGDLFEISTPKRKFDANKITFGGKYPYVARGDKNNGIRGLITEDTQYLNNGNTISFGQDTATMFYQPNAYFTGDKIKIFSFRQPEKFNQYIALSLIATMKLGFSHFAWGASFNVKKLQEVKIQLPTQNNTIDFDFMHTFIRAIEKIVIKEVVEWADKKIQATKQIINA